MQIQKDSASFRRATEKQFRLSPDMYKMRVEFENGLPVVVRRVVGSVGHVYTVRIWKDELTKFDASCECRASFDNLVCYHIAAVYDDYKRNQRNQNIWHIDLLPYHFRIEQEYHF